MNLTIDMPGVRGLGEAGEGVGSLAKDGAEVGSIDEDAAEVVSLAEDGAEVGSHAEDRAGVRNMAKDVPGVRGLGRAGAEVRRLAEDVSGIRSLGEASTRVRVLEEAIDRLNPGLNLGLVLSNVALSQELLEVGLIDKIKLKVFITTMYVALYLLFLLDELDPGLLSYTSPNQNLTN